MKKKELPSLNIGDRVLVTYYNSSLDKTLIEKQKTGRDIGFFVKESNNCLKLSRVDPVSYDDIDKVPEIKLYPIKNLIKIKKGFDV